MAFTCPRCGMTSHNPNDEREGYCGNCRDFTDYIYQGVAQHTWTPGCDGFHSPGPCTGAAVTELAVAGRPALAAYHWKDDNMAKEATDILVRTASPEVLDRTVQQLGPAVVVGAPDYVQVDGCYAVRVFGDPGFIKFAITNQGYGEVVRELEELL